MPPFRLLAGAGLARSFLRKSAATALRVSNLPGQVPERLGAVCGNVPNKMLFTDGELVRVGFMLAMCWLLHAG